MKSILLGLSLSIVVAFGAVMFVPARASAACEAEDRSAFALLPTWYQYLDLNETTCEVESFAIPGDLWKIGLAVIEIVLRIAGMVATGYVIFAGFKYVMSRGNPTEAAKARQTIIDALIGVAIASVATVLVAFLGRTLAP